MASFLLVLVGSAIAVSLIALEARQRRAPDGKRFGPSPDSAAALRQVVIVACAMIILYAAVVVAILATALSSAGP